MAKAPIEVFDFLDYRDFLRAYYAHKKSLGRGFSYRSFSRRAGLKSPNYLKLVIDDQRNLTPAMARRFGEACGLRASGLRFFVDLVAFNQAKTSEERAERYRDLTGHRSFRKAQRLDLKHAEYHSEWFIPAVRELAHRADFRAEPSWIASQMMPTISQADAERALEVLAELKMLKTNEDGTASPTDALVTTGPQTKWVHIGEYHRVMMQRAAESIDLVPAKERDISSLTLCVDAGKLQEIKAQLRVLRQSLLALADDSEDPARVIQINFQLFPLSQAASDDAEVES